MIHMIDSLMRGDANIPKYMKLAKGFWDEFYRLHEGDSVAELSEAMFHAQTQYEALFEYNRTLAKDTMALTAIASLYDRANGFSDRRALAFKVLKALPKSMVSAEIKSGMKKVAALYGLSKDAE